MKQSFWSHQWLKVGALILVLFVAGCSTPAVTTPKPDIRPVARGNKQIRESASRSKKYGQETLKLNQGIIENIDSSINALDKVLGR